MNKFILDRKYGDLLKSVGISIREALKRAQLPEDILSHKIPAMTIEEYIRFMNALRELSPDSSTPIKIGTIKNIETFSPPIFAAYCSKNSLTCMKRLSKYKKLIGPLMLLVNETTDSVILELSMEDSKYELPEFLVATEMVFLINLIRNATKTHIIPTEIMTIYKLNDINYEEFFGVKPKLGTKNKLTISKIDALVPFISENDTMWSYFEPELKRRLSEFETEDTCAAKVRSALIEILPSGESGIDSVAIKLGYSKRTLQRKLKEENTTFQKQLNHTRELLAKHYLKNSNITTDDIAYLLGYQDLNAFIRAFHIWTGSTITEYKKILEFNNCL